MLHAVLIKGSFQDSVTLMVISRDLSQSPSVRRVSVMMGTPANKDVYRETGLWHEALADATPSDLCIVVDSADESLAIAEDMAKQVSDRLTKLASSTRRAGYPVVRSWRRARQLLPQANLALISVAGQYACDLARQALEDGCHAMIFSDNVRLEEEFTLKTMARERGLLVMGPDCGTAIIHGMPLAFANRIAAGPIAVVGASGTGIQEITCQIARLGGGITHALGLGGRDLSEQIGGLSAATALDFVARDAATRVIVFISKQPAPAVKDRLMDTMRQLGKPVVALFLGDRSSSRLVGNVHVARTLDQAAAMAVELAAISAEVSSSSEVAGLAVCGLYTGGTLAGEAADLLAEALALPHDAAQPDGYLLRAKGHRIIDLGDDVYTRGRPHPMIDPYLRNAMIEELCGDRSVGVLMADVVLGFGAHIDPAGELARAVTAMKAARGDAPIVVIATLTGSADDPQDFVAQKAKLEQAGIKIADSVRAAVSLALLAITASPLSRGDASALLYAPPAVVNIGLRSFADDLHANGAKVVHEQWEPAPEGSERLRRLAASMQ